MVCNTSSRRYGGPQQYARKHGSCGRGPRFRRRRGARRQRLDEQAAHWSCSRSTWAARLADSEVAPRRRPPASNLAAVFEDLVGPALAVLDSPLATKAVYRMLPAHRPPEAMARPHPAPAWCPPVHDSRPWETAARETGGLGSRERRQDRARARQDRAGWRETAVRAMGRLRSRERRHDRARARQDRAGWWETVARLTGGLGSRVRRQDRAGARQDRAGWRETVARETGCVGQGTPPGPGGVPPGPGGAGGEGEREAALAPAPWPRCAGCRQDRSGSRPDRAAYTERRDRTGGVLKKYSAYRQVDITTRLLIAHILLVVPEQKHIIWPLEASIARWPLGAIRGKPV
ncbi:hypothetical protein FA95DRAFT_1575153 [Auriscalpium vulgare]|uniref:Uncharacterized protein n=1 Tax=Auriscalpium vulgare TaxID=40419 RepID=A0ACB8RGM6_9AGAM|nr:hypothetical protein FA95DRAFT_1575153 [Auriscalpium vulgare]